MPNAASPLLPTPSLKDARKYQILLRASLRKFFIHDVFSNNSSQPTFFFTSNIAGFSFSAPAAGGESDGKEQALKSSRLAGCRELQHTKHQHQGATGTKPLQHITEKASGCGTSPGVVSLPGRHPYTCSNAAKKNHQPNPTAQTASI